MVDSAIFQLLSQHSVALKDNYSKSKQENNNSLQNFCITTIKRSDIPQNQLYFSIHLQLIFEHSLLNYEVLKV